MAADTSFTLPDQDGAVLLNDVRRFIVRFVVLTDAQADACALWVMHTHVLHAAEATPYLHIYSPLLRSGKTLLLTVLNLLVAKPWMTGRVTGAVLVRKTAKEQPTLLLDESDAAFRAEPEYAEALRGILNTGFQRNGCISICVKNAGDWGYRDFPTFSPKAIAGIGRLPQTIEDRSIPINLKRKLRQDERERFRPRKARLDAKPLSDRLVGWAQENLNRLRDAQPPLPTELNDRQQDVCEPLLAIADRVGGEWPTRARRALVALSTSNPPQDDSLQLRLLDDIRALFDRSGAGKLASRELVNDLTEDETSPWREVSHGKPLTASQLATMLRPFGISPRDMRFGPQTLKGYNRTDFEDAWERYLPDFSSGSAQEAQQGRQSSIHAGSDDISDGQQNRSVAVVENENQAGFMRVVADVAPPSLHTGGPATGRARVRFCWDHPFDNSWRQESDGTWACGHC